MVCIDAILIDDENIWITIVSIGLPINVFLDVGETEKSSPACMCISLVEMILCRVEASKNNL